MGWWKRLMERLRKPKKQEERKYLYEPRKDEGLAETRMLTADEMAEIDKAVHDMSEDGHWTDIDD